MEVVLEGSALLVNEVQLAVLQWVSSEGRQMLFGCVTEVYENWAGLFKINLTTCRCLLRDLFEGSTAFGLPVVFSLDKGRVVMNSLSGCAESTLDYFSSSFAWLYIWKSSGRRRDTDEGVQVKRNKIMSVVMRTVKAAKRITQRELARQLEERMGGESVGQLMGDVVGSLVEKEMIEVVGDEFRFV